MISFTGEALRCNYCFGKGTTLCTATSVQTCSRLANACGAVILGSPLSKSSTVIKMLEMYRNVEKAPHTNTLDPPKTLSTNNVWKRGKKVNKIDFIIGLDSAW